jgi:hypothetical protein
MTDRELAEAIPTDELDLKRLINNSVMFQSQIREFEAYASAARQNHTDDLAYWEEKTEEAKSEAALIDDLIEKKRKALANG